MAWAISRQNNVVSTHSNNRNVSYMEEYKGTARSIFNLELPSRQISRDFLIILASSQPDGVKFNENHEIQLSGIIDDFKQQINTTPSDKCLKETYNIRPASVTLRRIEKASDAVSSCFLLEVSGRLEYTLKQNADMLKRSYAIESSAEPEDNAKKKDLPSNPSSSGWGWGKLNPLNLFSTTSAVSHEDASKPSGSKESSE